MNRISTDWLKSVGFKIGNGTAEHGPFMIINQGDGTYTLRGNGFTVYTTRDQVRMLYKSVGIELNEQVPKPFGPTTVPREAWFRSKETPSGEYKLQKVGPDAVCIMKGYITWAELATSYEWKYFPGDWKPCYV